MTRRRLGALASAIAWFGVILPTAAMATEPNAAVNSSDVVILGGELLVGRVVDARGAAKAGEPVSIRYAGAEVVSTTTDANGIFAARGLRAGEHQLVTLQGTRVCRLWTNEMVEPPAAERPLVLSDTVVRGQAPTGMVSWMKAHPYITATTIVAAIAIPLALADDADNHH